MPVTPALRLPRAVVFAAVCVMLTLAGHLVAGTEGVSAGAVGAGFAAACVVAWLLCCAERSLPTILGCLLGGQFFLHALFAAAPPGGGHHGPAVDLGTCAAVGMAGPASDPLVDQCVQPAAHGTTGGSGAAMTLAHLVVALVAAWWLRRGERAVWTLARLSARLSSRLARTVSAALIALLRPVLPLACPVAVTVRAQWPATARPTAWPLRHCVIGRAPPRGSTVVAL